MPGSELILDTGGWLMALAGQEPYASALNEASRPIVPGLVLAEVDYHLRDRRREMRRLLEEVAAGEYAYEPPTLPDLERAREMDQKFGKLKLGLVDASIVALSERLGIHRVLTTDSAFVVVRFGPGWSRALELVVPPPRARKRW
ncbi:MAG: PIN domain-containing protein [Myxococcaceae bacterium]|nr:PIN domain-containing protein [Myxococcaceae bacterium]MCI0672033.1 PIN domain-containing protein [Myxococcaceae bacterium]